MSLTPSQSVAISIIITELSYLNRKISQLGDMDTKEKEVQLKRIDDRHTQLKNEFERCTSTRTHETIGAYEA